MSKSSNRLQINWTQGNSVDCLRASHPLLSNVHLDGLHIYKKPSTGFYHCAVYEVEQQFDRRTCEEMQEAIQQLFDAAVKNLHTSLSGWLGYELQ